MRLLVLLRHDRLLTRLHIVSSIGGTISPIRRIVVLRWWLLLLMCIIVAILIVCWNRWNLLMLLLLLLMVVMGLLVLMRLMVVHLPVIVGMTVIVVVVVRIIVVVIVHSTPAVSHILVEIVPVVVRIVLLISAAIHRWPRVIVAATFCETTPSHASSSTIASVRAHLVAPSLVRSLLLLLRIVLHRSFHALVRRST